MSDPSLRIEWLFNGQKIRQGHRFRTTHDFGYVALDILYAYVEDSGTYTCVATNEVGEATSTCTVTVQDSGPGIERASLHPSGLAKIHQLGMRFFLGVYLRGLFVVTDNNNPFFCY